MTRVVIFAPAPMLTVTVEEHRGEPDVHLHVGGQGVWQARMLTALEVDVTMVCSFAGEAGLVAHQLLDGEGFEVIAIERSGVSPAYIHDRRDGERKVIVEAQGEPLSRHDLDALYSATLREAADADLVILSGTVGAALTAGQGGVKALAVSLDVGLADDVDEHWQTAAAMTDRALTALTDAAPATILNLNVPNVPDAAALELVEVPLAPFGIVQTTMTELDGDETRLSVREHDAADAPGSDMHKLAEGFATITSVLTIAHRVPAR